MMLSALSFAPMLLLSLQSSTEVEQILYPVQQTETASSEEEDSADPYANSKIYLDSSDQQVTKQADAQQDENVMEAVVETRQVEAASSDNPVEQISVKDKNADATPEITDKSEGYDTAIVRVEGEDRCQAELMSAENREYCNNVIENRSSEFAGPGPIQLTPEQKLLGERAFDLTRAGPDAAARRLASGQQSPNDQENQQIASIVLRPPPTPRSRPDPAEEENDLGVETEAIIEAIVNNINNNSGQ